MYESEAVQRLCQENRDSLRATLARLLGARRMAKLVEIEAEESANREPVHCRRISGATQYKAEKWRKAMNRSERHE